VITCCDRKRELRNVVDKQCYYGSEVRKAAMGQTWDPDWVTRNLYGALLCVGTLPGKWPFGRLANISEVTLRWEIA
jgi:hypothetical protein